MLEQAPKSSSVRRRKARIHIQLEFPRGGRSNQTHTKLRHSFPIPTFRVTNFTHYDMRFAIFIFISTSLALLIPRCDTGYARLGSDNNAGSRSNEASNSDHASSSIDARELSPSAVVVATSASKSTYPYTKKIKTVSTQPTTTPLPTRALTTEVEDPEDCVPHSICVDKISPCGKRYGG